MITVIFPFNKYRGGGATADITPLPLCLSQVFHSPGISVPARPPDYVPLRRHAGRLNYLL